MTTLTLPRLRREWRARGAQAAVMLVVGAGRVIGWARRRSALLPGLAGAAGVSWGLALITHQAGTGIAVGGVLLLAMDRQIKLRPGGDERIQA